MGPPIEYYVHPGVAVKFEVLTKMIMQPMTATDAIPPGANTIPPQASVHPVSESLARSAVVAAQAVADSVRAQEEVYLSQAPAYTVTPTGQTTGPK